MTAPKLSRTWAAGALLMGAFVAAAGWHDLGARTPRASAPAGVGPRLVAIDPLPEAAVENCTWQDMSMPARWREAIWTDRLAAAGQQGTSTRAASRLDRAPLRTIRDTYPTYSTVFVDAARDEIVLQDENLFEVATFVRTTNSSPTGSAAEPKRRIGGLNTKIEFNSGLYIDPKSGDAYSVANDTIDTMVVFSRNARGNVAPDRELKTPHRTYAITADEEREELYLTVQHPPQILVYKKMAKNLDKPLRTIDGPSTLLQDPHGIALDTKNRVIYVSNHGNASNPRIRGGGSFELPSISMYPMDGSGDTPALGVIKGPKTQLNWPANIFFDEQHGELFVANDGTDAILVFRSTDRGDVAPVRVIRGPQTGLKNPTGVFLDVVHQELAVANMGNHTASIYARTADGDAKPLRTIRSAPAGKIALAIGNPGAAGYDSKRNEILVPN